jgi:hypothetical protein
VGDHTFGEWNEERNLSFYIVYNASHMASYDAAPATLDILNRFLDGHKKPPMEKEHPIGSPMNSPSHFAAGLFLVVFMVTVLFVGFFVRRKLRNITGRTQWSTVPDDDDIELSTSFNLNEFSSSRQRLHSE